MGTARVPPTVKQQWWHQKSAAIKLKAQTDLGVGKVGGLGGGGVLLPHENKQANSYNF